MSGFSGAPAFQSYTPTVSAASGTITTSSATGLYWQMGKTVYVIIKITVTTNGTGAGSLRGTLPVTASTTAPMAYLAGAQLSAGKAVNGQVLNSTTCAMILYDGTYPGVSGDSCVVSGIYQAA